MARRFPISKNFKASNPSFRLSSISRATIQRGQQTIIVKCLEDAYPNALTLEQLRTEVDGRGYRATFRNATTDIHDSILYHLNRLKSVESIRL